MSAGGAPGQPPASPRKRLSCWASPIPAKQYFQGPQEAGKSAGSGQMNEALMQMQTQQSA